jgi:hypothetical protein
MWRCRAATLGHAEEGVSRAVEVTPSSTSARSTYPIFEAEPGSAPVAEMSRRKICRRRRPQIPDSRDPAGLTDRARLRLFESRARQGRRTCPPAGRLGAANRDARMAAKPRTAALHLRSGGRGPRLRKAPGVGGRSTPRAQSTEVTVVEVTVTRTLPGRCFRLVRTCGEVPGDHAWPRQPYRAGTCWFIGAAGRDIDAQLRRVSGQGRGTVVAD